MRDSKACLYNVQWQELRVSLLRYWVSEQGARRNIAALEYYLSYESSIDERATRLWRVVNLLNAVRMSYSGQGLRGSIQDNLVHAYRLQITAMRQQLHIDAKYVVDSDDTVRADWSRLTAKQRKAILDNLGNRKKLHADSKHRDELGHFLDVVRSVHD